ncbi:MAG: TonB-dependent receptor [Candidatus Solibacter usitatus]|nr:TonB-dependent receptor [Candidatus Solibacter usitatus]
MLRLFTALALFVSFAWSQTTSTSILGTVSDATGAVVAGAKVKLLNVRTGVAREESTSATGDYNFPLIDVGVYEVTVEVAGFKTETRRNIELQLNQKARVDFAMQVGAQSDRIEITGEVAALKTDESSLGQVVEQRRLSELPLNGRNLAGLAVMQPGVQFGGRMGMDGLTGGGGGVPIPGASISLSANGQRDTNFHATLDGVVATEARVNTVPFTPSIEAVEEFKVQAGSYTAEYGTNSGAQLTIVLKSGTNQFHATAFEFLRNDVLDAEGYFQNYFTAANAARRPKDKLRQNQYGVVFSGPVVVPGLYNGRDKTFFMFDWEARNRRQPGLVGNANVPSDAFRNGDLSALLRRTNAAGAALASVQITDPLTGDPIANNMIPASRISSTAKALMAFYPAAQRQNTDPLSGFTYSGEGGVRLDDDQRYIRVDHNFSAKDKIFGRYAFQDITYLTTPGDNPNFTYFVAGRNQNLGFQWLHIFTPNTINEFRYGYNRSVDNTLNPRSNTSLDLDSLGLTGFRLLTDGNRKFTSREAGIPGFNIQSFAGIGDRDGGNGFDFNDLHQFSDNITLTRGVHNFKTGFDYRRVSLFRGAANTARGDMTFQDNVAKSAFAAFLLGYPSLSNSPEGLPLTDVRQNRYGFYFQDDWKASRRLTINLGVRYEYNSVATDVQGLWRSISFATQERGYPTLIPTIRTPYAFYKPEKKNFMPRIGIAYRVSERMVVRSGFGLYYNVHQLNNYTILNLNPPLSGSSAFAQTVDATGKVIGTPALTFASPFGVVNNTSLISANTLNPDNWQPRTIQWSFDIQRQLPGRVVLTIGYVGSKGVHIDNTVELNNPDPAVNTATSTAQSRRPIQFVVDGPGGPLRPLSRHRWLDAGNNSWYHGLQTNLEKRLSHGVLMNFAYTFSQSLGEGYGRNESFGGTSNTYQNPSNRAAEKGLYPFDVRHNAVTSFLYEVPTASAFKRGVGRMFFGDWQLNGIWTIRSGFPFSVSQDNVMNTFNSAARPDRLGSGVASTQKVDRWFDTEAFRVLTCSVASLSDRCRYGNAGTAILRGPGFNNLDFSIMKNFAIREGMKVQFRTEMFNVANHPLFNLPNRNLTGSAAFLPSAPGQPDPVQGGRQGGPGAITSTLSPMRIIQFGLKFIF